jgi:hypothetical protein
VSVVETDSTQADRDPHPSWVVPIWMLLALVAVFAMGCGCGSFVTYLSMLGPSPGAD